MAYWANRKARALVTRAVDRMKESERLRASGDREASLALAREGLLLLGDPSVNRAGAVELTAIIHLTIAVEELANDLGQPGADKKDVVDTLAMLKRTADQMKQDAKFASSAPSGWQEMQATWIPRLEARLAG